MRLVYEIDIYEGDRRFVDRIAVPQLPVAAIKFASNQDKDLSMSIKCSGKVKKEVLEEAASEIDGRVSNSLTGGLYSLVTSDNKNIVIVVKENVERLIPDDEDEDEEEDGDTFDPFDEPLPKRDLFDEFDEVDEEDVTGSGFSQFF